MNIQQVVDAVNNLNILAITRILTRAMVEGDHAINFRDYVFLGPEQRHTYLRIKNAFCLGYGSIVDGNIIYDNDAPLLFFTNLKKKSKPTRLDAASSKQKIFYIPRSHMSETQKVYRVNKKRQYLIYDRNNTSTKPTESTVF